MQLELCRVNHYDHDWVDSVPSASLERHVRGNLHGMRPVRNSGMGNWESSVTMFCASSQSSPMFEILGTSSLDLHSSLRSKVLSEFRCETSR